MPRSRSFAVSVLCVALIVLRSAAAHELGPGDVVISDGANDRLLHYDPDTGTVDAFSPRTPSDPNLMVHPGGVAIDTNGMVYVISRADGRLVEIDPQTGLQTIVLDETQQPLDIGPAPIGLEIGPVASHFFYRRDLFVSSEGEIWRVRRPGIFLGAPTSSLFESDPDLAGTTAALAVVAENGDLANIYSIGVVGMAKYVFGTGETYPELTGSGYVGIDAGFGLLAYTRQNDCNAADNQSGVYEFDASGIGQSIPLVVAGLLSCPGALAIASPTEIYVARKASYPASILRVADTGAGWAADATPITMPDTTEISDLAVVPPSYLPEPGVVSGEAAALALGLVAWPRRRRLTR